MVVVVKNEHCEGLLININYYIFYRAEFGCHRRIISEKTERRGLKRSCTVGKGTDVDKEKGKGEKIVVIS